jgi:LPS export ABC transporter protein LptC
MIQTAIKKTLQTATFLVVLLFLSCESNFKEVQKINFADFVPSGDATKINLKYTDSGRIKSVLVSERMLDYGNMIYPFSEFPNGISVTFFDKKKSKTFIKADYAVSYKGTKIIDLQGNVKITSEKNQVLETNQLFYDQKNEWFFTEEKFKLTDPKGISYGQGIDFSSDFRIVHSQKIIGTIDSNE